MRICYHNFSCFAKSNPPAECCSCNQIFVICWYEDSGQPHKKWSKDYDLLHVMWFLFPPKCIIKMDHLSLSLSLTLCHFFLSLSNTLMRNKSQIWTSWNSYNENKMCDGDEFHEYQGSAYSSLCLLNTCFELLDLFACWVSGQLLAFNAYLDEQFVLFPRGTFSFGLFALLNKLSTDQRYISKLNISLVNKQCIWGIGLVNDFMQQYPSDVLNSY